MDFSEIAKAVGGWQPLTVFLVCLVAGPLLGVWLSNRQAVKMADILKEGLKDALGQVTKSVDANTSATREQTGASLAIKSATEQQTAQLVELRRESRDVSTAVDRIDRRLSPRGG